MLLYTIAVTRRTLHVQKEKSFKKQEPPVFFFFFFFFGFFIHEQRLFLFFTRNHILDLLIL